MLFIALGISGATFIWILWHERGQANKEVVFNLSSSSTVEQYTESFRSLLGDELGKIGIFQRETRKNFRRGQRCKPLIFATGIIAIMVVIGSETVTALIAGGVGLAFSYILQRRSLKLLEQEYKRRLEFHLPIVMERLVIAVQAGLDVLPALRAILEFDTKDQNGISQQQPDPVTQLLAIVYQLSEAGLGFEESLRTIAELCECTAVRHAFLHLAIAQREGGELSMPLRELSDSTQMYYQESVEEEIAKMPVRATMPLLCTFAGLLLIFLASPLVQVMNLTAHAMPK